MGHNIAYKLDRQFVIRTKLKIIAIGLSFICAGILLSYSMVIEKDWKLLLGFCLIFLGYQKIKELEYWRDNNNKISLVITEDYIKVSDFNETRILSLTTLTKADVQPIHGKIKSIVLHDSNGVTTKLEGFETMDLVVSQLKEILGESNVKTAKYFHR